MIKVDIGSGRKHFEDYITVDNDQKVGADICVDIEKVKIEEIDKIGRQENGSFKNIKIITLKNNTDEIRAFHILEHLRPENRVKVIKLFFDLLKPGGILHIEVPIATSAEFWQDPTHNAGWTERTFWYFTKGNKFGEAFTKRNSDARLFEKVEDECRNDWAYRIKFKKPL